MRTKGPWRLDKNVDWYAEHTDTYIWGAGGEMILRINKCLPEPKPSPIIGCGGNPEDNALLILAAEDLLEACESFLRILPKSSVSHDDMAMRAVAGCIAMAVAKATGKKGF